MANLAWQITSPGTLTLNDLGPLPDPGPNQVVIGIKAVSLNYRDLLVVNHSPAYPIRAGPNLVPCSDGAGAILRTGPGSRWNVGERVYVHPNPWMTGSDPRDFVFDQTMGGGKVDGTLRKYMIVDDDRVIQAPGGLSYEEACTLYTAGVTAWHALFYGLIKLKPGMKVLTMGTGGVSCYAIMLAAAFGAEVVATSSSDDKLQVAKELGATHLVNYKKHPNWAEEVLNATSGEGVDIVVDVVGAESIEQALRCTRHGGLVSLVGVLSGDPYKPVDIMTTLLYGSKTIQGVLGAGSRQMSEELSAFLEKHNLHPPVAEAFDFERPKEALEALKKLSVPGKVVIKV